MKLKDIFKKIKAFIKGLFKKDETPSPIPLPEIFAPKPPETPSQGYPPVIIPPIQPNLPFQGSNNESTWPSGAYEFQPGVYYVGTAGPFKSPEEYWKWAAAVRNRDENLENWQVENGSMVFTSGRFAYNEIGGNDLAYVRFRSHDYKLKTNRDLFYDLFRGTHQQISITKQEADRLNPGSNFRATDNQALVHTIDWLFERNKVN